MWKIYIYFWIRFMLIISNIDLKKVHHIYIIYNYITYETKTTSRSRQVIVLMNESLNHWFSSKGSKSLMTFSIDNLKQHFPTYFSHGTLSNSSTMCGSLHKHNCSTGPAAVYPLCTEADGLFQKHDTSSNSLITQ